MLPFLQFTHLHDLAKCKVSFLCWIRKLICLPFGLDLIYAWILSNLFLTRGDNIHKSEILDRQTNEY